MTQPVLYTPFPGEQRADDASLATSPVAATDYASSDICPGERTHDVVGSRLFGVTARSLTSFRQKRPPPAAQPYLADAAAQMHVRAGTVIPLRMHIKQHERRGAMPGGAFPFLAPAA